MPGNKLARSIRSRISVSVLAGIASYDLGVKYSKYNYFSQAQVAECAKRA